MTKTQFATTLAALLLLGCQADAQVSARSAKKPARLRVEVLAEYPHDRAAYTQGLLWHDGVLWESTGQYRQSTVRKVDPRSGTVLVQSDLDPGLFGEGLALAGDRFIQLTWQTGLALVYDANLATTGQFTYPGEGWGLAFDGRRLVMSNGSPVITFRDPETFKELGTIHVTLEGRPLARLNELEVADGWIYANVWRDDRIFRIAPETGKVRAVIDASDLLSPMERFGADVLNGIAYDPESQTFWITGKYWPTMFQVVFVEKP